MDDNSGGNGSSGESRQHMELRERAMGAREDVMQARESLAGTRDEVSGIRELAVSEREELARLRDHALHVREQMAVARMERDRLVAEMREANQNLMIATMRSQALADDAESAHLAITASEERFRSLVTTSSAIVFQADADGRVRVDPHNWEILTGMRVDGAGQESGHAWLQAIHPEDWQHVREAWADAVATRRHFESQYRLRRHDGTYAWVAARAVPIPEEGAIREWIGMMADISDRMRIEEAREQFIAILGHDLRNPLGAILTSAQLLSDATPKQAQTAARIIRSAHRMEVMIQDVLDFARGRLGGGIPIKRTRTDLRKVCMDQVAEAKAGHPGRVFVCECSGELEGDWDPDRMEQVFSNLIGNAIYHGADPITVTLREDSDQVVATVHNLGPPIPAALLPKMFEPFRRGSGDRDKGLGLGLFIASAIVQAHAGTITVRSFEGEGTIFTARLPKDDPRARKPRN